MSSEKLEDLNLSNDEIKRISDAMKDEQFRKLFVEYAEEISNPENKRLYEEELTQLESDRGVDVKFVNPTPGHVLKTSINGERKCFINICQCDKLDKPSSTREKNDSGKNGLMWNIPHSFAPPREDLDKSGQKCQVFDVVFHPDAYRMAESNKRFMKLVEDTAIDGIEKQFNVKLDHKNIRRPNMSFKGTASATIIRSKSQNCPPAPNNINDVLRNMSYPFQPEAQKTKSPELGIDKTEKKSNVPVCNSQPTKPKYSIKYRSELDLQEFTNHPSQMVRSSRSKELVVTIELPLLKSAASVQLDIFDKRLLLESNEPAAYKLDLALPYPVYDDEGTAKFDKIKRALIITLQVQKSHLPAMPEVEFNRDLVPNLNSESKPLIEVLDQDQQMTSESSMKSSEPVHMEDCITLPERTTNVLYTKPDYTYTQDIDTINFIINVRNISLDSVSKSFPSPNIIVLKFVSSGSGCFPMYYSLYLEFPAECHIASEHCTVDISANTLVLLMLKSKSCRSLWKMFKAGVDATSLEDHLFLTESNLQSQLDDLDQQAVNKPINTHQTEVTVSEMSQKKLTINLHKLSVKEEDEEYDPPSSADIEVVHKIVLPKLQSILKQRTVSDSSDDYGLSPTSESPRSDEDGRLNKSVSFNNRIDSTCFDSNKCPDSVKTTLHNKHKKARRKENMKERRERQRNNSTGSEHSSDDGTSKSDTPSASEFEKIDEDVNEDVEKFAHSLSHGFTDISNGKKCTEVKFICNSKSESVKVDREDELKPAVVPTNGYKKKRNRGKGRHKKAYQSHGDQVATTESEDTSDSMLETNTKISQKDSAAADQEGLSEQQSPVDQTTANTFHCKESSKLNGMMLDGGDISQPGDLQKIVEQTDSSVLKILASNKTKPDSDDDINAETPTINGCTLTSNEHKTQCAFQFSNSVIYDLDND